MGRCTVSSAYNSGQSIALGSCPLRNDAEHSEQLRAPGRAQAFSWLHGAARMCGLRWYHAADKRTGRGCDLAAVLGGLFLVATRRPVTGHAGR